MAELIPIISEDFYTWVAPDGNLQLTTLAPDYVSCIAITKLLHKQGVGQSAHEMGLKGFRIEKVKLTIEAADTLAIVAFHHWLVQQSSGDRTSLVALIKHEVMVNHNPQAFELIDATGWPRNNDGIFGQAADILIQAYKKEQEG